MKRQTKWMISSTLAMVLAGGVCSGAYAANEGNVYSLNPVVVTATRTEKTDLDTPASTDIITEKDIKETGAKTVFDALSFTTGITNFSYGPGGMDYGAMDSRVNIRGYDRGALILVNGAPINLNGKNSLDGIMVDNVGHIEVVKGASSVLYGAEAFGGVVNIITKQGGPTKMNVTAAAGNRGYKKYSASYRSPEASVAFSRQYFGAQDRTSPDRADRGYYNNRSKGTKNNYSANFNFTDQLSFNVMRSESDSTYGQTQYNKSTEAANKKASKDYNYRDIKDNLSFVFHDKDRRIRSVLFYNDRDLYGRTRNRGNYKWGENTSNYKAYNVGLDTQKEWRLRDGKDSFLLGGLVSKEKYRGVYKGITTDRVADRENFALYTQYSWQVTDRFNATIGVRGEHINDKVKDQNVFLPQFQTLYKVTDNSSWYINVGKAFQMPVLSDMMQKAKDGSYQAVSGKNLKPLEGWNYETGYKIINGDSSWKFALYHMDFDNSLQWKQQSNGEYIRINTGKFKNTGFETEFASRLSDRLRVNAGFSYSDPKNRTTAGGKWEQTYPKLQFDAGLVYSSEKWDAGTRLNWLTKRLKNRDGGTNPDLINLNAFATYKPNADDAITLNLNNILDRHNVITNGAYEYWDLPFNWTLSYSHSF